MAQTELEDYEGLLGDNFDAQGFANDLLLATNATRSELDISTAIKRVKFDVNNIDLQLEKVSGEGHESLIKEIHTDIAVKTQFAQLSAPLDHVSTSYQRLDKDLLVPYDKAVKTQDVLKRIHTASHLLRSLTYFLHLVQQIEEIQSSPHFEQSVKSPKTLFKLSNLHNQLKTHIEDHSNLKSLKVMRDYEPMAFEKQRQFRELIQGQLRSISDKSLDSQQIAHTKAQFQALYMLDPEAFAQTVSTLLSNSVTVSVNILTRVLTSPRNINFALDETLKRANVISRLAKVLGETAVDNKTLLNEALGPLEVDSLVSAFWRDVARKFEPKFRDTMTRGGPVGKSLISYKDQIRTSIKRAVLASEESLRPEGVEVKMMLNAVASLDRSR